MSNQLIIHEITLRNFKSFGNNLTVLKIKQNTLALIVGKNKDDSINGQLESNGAGKTTLLEALSYASYGRTIENIKVDSLINKTNKRNMEVSFVIERNGKFHRIMRYRKNKDRGGTGVSIFEGTSLDSLKFENLANLKDIAQAGTADAQIVEILGLPFEIFSRIVVFSATHTPFLKLDAPAQKAIIEELLGMSELSEKAEKLKKILSNEKKELDTLEEVEKEINKQKERIQSQIESMTLKVKAWDDNKEADLKRLNNEYNEITAINFDKQEQLINEYQSISEEIKDSAPLLVALEKDIASMKEKISKRNTWNLVHAEELAKLEKQRSSFEAFDFNEQLNLLQVKDSLVTLQSQIDTLSSNLQTELSGYSKESSKAADQIEHLQDNKCPYCLQQFADAQSKLKELHTIIDTNYDLEKKVRKKLETVAKQKQTAADELVSVKQKLKFNKIDEVHSENSRRITVEDRYNLIVNQTNPFEDDIEGLEEMIASAEQTMVEGETSINDLQAKRNAVGDKMVFNSISELERNRAKHQQLKTKISELLLSSNPLEETLLEMQNITVDGSNSLKIAELTRSIEHKTFLHKLLTKPDSFIRKSLLADRLKYLNQQMRYYLDALALPHKVAFTEELEVHIAKFNNELVYNELSAGQKARVNIALAFAFRDVLQGRFGRINFCILDECLDTGLSNVGVQNAVNMIKKIAIENQLSMFVISHRDETISSFNNVIEIELSGGFSSIV